MQRFQSDGRPSPKPLIPRVDLNVYGFQRRNARPRLCIVVAENHRRTDDFSHELGLRDADVQRNLRAVRELKCAATARLDIDCAEPSRGQASVDRAGVYQEPPLATPPRFHRVGNGNRDVRGDH